MRTVGRSTAEQGIRALRDEMQAIDPDWELVEAAAVVKAGGGLSYADAFCVVTAQRLGAQLWTGDPEIVNSANSLPCDVVDLR